MSESTRLTNQGKQEAIEELTKILDNLYRYTACPLTTKDQVVSLWNGKLPAQLLHAIRDAQEYGINIPGGMQAPVVLLNDVFAVRLQTNMIDLGNPHWGILGINATMAIKDPDKYVRITYSAVTSTTYALRLDDAYLVQILGQEVAHAFMAWAHDAIIVTEELGAAISVINDIFGMIKTAGQLKRMCPDLMRYLPDRNRAAFESQKRASSIPFEWAPYPKGNVERMIATLGKGYLLKGLSPASRSELTWDKHDKHTWAERARIIN